MLHEPAKNSVFLITLWAMIIVLLMNRTLEVLIQSLQRIETACAEVALKTVSIPSSICSEVLGVLSRVGDEFLGDDMVPIKATDNVVDTVTVKTGHAGTRFEVDRHC